MEKEDAYRRHIRAIQTIDEFNLPYRVLLNYYKKYPCYKDICPREAHYEDICVLNPNYPYPGFCCDDLEELGIDDTRVITGPYKDDVLSSKFDLKVIPNDADRQAIIDKHCAELPTWNLSTPEGLKVWRYEFAHFLSTENFKEYRSFDFWGKNITESPEHKQRISEWKTLQKKYLKNPTSYRQTEPLYCNYEGKSYTVWHFNFNPREEN